jgi:hypothetical protein
MPVHRVAVVLIADVPGVDAHDAAHRLTRAIGDRVGAQLPSPTRGGALPPIDVRDVIEVGAAVRNGLLALRPTGRETGR